MSKINRVLIYLLKLCGIWLKSENVKLITFNDSFLLACHVFFSQLNFGTIEEPSSAEFTKKNCVQSLKVGINY